MAKLPDPRATDAAARPDVDRTGPRDAPLGAKEAAPRAPSERPLWGEHPIPELRGASGLHVVPSDGQWAVRVRETDAVAGVTPTKAEAMQLARRIAVPHELAIIEHGRDGKIQRTFEPRV